MSRWVDTASPRTSFFAAALREGRMNVCRFDIFNTFSRQMVYSGPSGVFISKSINFV
ncbi:hypothetical protein JCM10003_1832 [Bacteroides pyogenes JCM 10003]|nr:hypothetical protein JCM10003_1832 [Bacteroides pyogenes JCM 10003]